MMDSNTRWYALQTKTQYERVVARGLSGKGLEEFVPLFDVRRRYGSEVRVVEEPMFPGYVFCRFDLAERLSVLRTPYVRSIVGVAGRAIPVRDGEIEAVQSIVRAGAVVHPWPYLKEGDWVRIVCGSMEGVEGILVEKRKRHRLVVSISLLERSVAVDLDEAWIAPIPSRDESWNPVRNHSVVARSVHAAASRSSRNPVGPIGWFNA